MMMMTHFLCHHHLPRPSEDMIIRGYDRDAHFCPNTPISTQRQLEEKIEDEQQKFLASGIDHDTGTSQAIAKNTDQWSDRSVENLEYHLPDIIDLNIYGEIMTDRHRRYLTSNMRNVIAPISSYHRTKTVSRAGMRK